MEIALSGMKEREVCTFLSNLTPEPGKIKGSVDSG